MDLLRAQIAFVSTRGSDAPAMLLRAADRLAPLSHPLACETYLEALAAAMFAGRLALPGGTMLDVAMSVKAGLHPSPANGLELLLEAIATLITESFEAFVPMLHRSFRAFDAGGMPVDEQVRWKWLPTIFSAHVWDDASWLAICAPHVRIARETGARGLYLRTGMDNLPAQKLYESCGWVRNSFFSLFNQSLSNHEIGFSAGRLQRGNEPDMVARFTKCAQPL